MFGLLGCCLVRGEQSITTRTRIGLLVDHYERYQRHITFNIAVPLVRRIWPSIRNRSISRMGPQVGFVEGVQSSGDR